MLLNRGVVQNKCKNTSMTWHALRLLWKRWSEHWHKYRNVPSSTSIFLSHGTRPNSTMGRKVLETWSSSSARLKLFSAHRSGGSEGVSLGCMSTATSTALAIAGTASTGLVALTWAGVKHYVNSGVWQPQYHYPSGSWYSPHYYGHVQEIWTCWGPGVPIFMWTLGFFMGIVLTLCCLGFPRNKNFESSNRSENRPSQSAPSDPCTEFVPASNPQQMLALQDRAPANPLQYRTDSPVKLAATPKSRRNRTVIR